MICADIVTECLSVIANVDKIPLYLLLDLLYLLLHILLHLLLLLHLLCKSCTLSKRRKIGEIS